MDYNWSISYVQVGGTSVKVDDTKPVAQILQSTRELLQQHYSQIPQLSCGYSFNLNSPFRI